VNIRKRLLVSVALVAALAAIAVGVGSTIGAEWSYFDATVHESGAAPTRIQTWIRRDEAITVATSASGIDEVRCVAGVLTTRATDSPSIVVHNDIASSVCVGDATARLFGFRALVSQGLARRGGAGPVDPRGKATSRYTVATAGYPYQDFELEDETSLPVRAMSSGGRATTWTYADATSAPPPPAAPTDGLSREIYLPLEASTAARHLGMPVLPRSIAGLPLAKTFEYDADTGTGPAYYAIWNRGFETDEIQMVVNVVAPEIAAGYEHRGGVVQYTANEDGALLHILAPDDVMLRQAVSALRPQYVSDLAKQLGAG